MIFFWWIPGPRAVWIYRVVISLIWSYLTLFVIVGFFQYRVYNSTDFFFVRPLFTQLPLLLINPSFQRPTPYWCWISGSDAERIVGEYLWLWIAALLSILLYTLLFFRLRGNIQVDPLNWKRIHVRLHPDSYFQPTAVSREAMGVIWYPICHTILILPLSIVRWITFHPLGKNAPEIPFPFIAMANTIFTLSGVVSVVLIMFTRRNLLLLGPNRGVVN